MSLFQFQWLRRFIRRNTRPIPEDTAGLWKKRLSIAYMVLAWNAFGFVCYSVATGKADWASYHGLPTDTRPSAVQWADTLKIKDAKVLKISGLKTKWYDIRDGEVVEEASDAKNAEEIQT